MPVALGLNFHFLSFMDLQSFVSWNVRGANGISSQYLIRMLVNRQKPAIVCLQETKCSLWTEKNLKSFGMPSPFGWHQSPSVGQSGGLLTLWNKSVFSLSPSSSYANWSSVRGTCTLDNRELLILNCYAPQSLESKKRVWKEILSELATATEHYVILMGDFNAVRRMDERANSKFNHLESSAFNDFIDSTGLLEVQLANSKFTWFGPGNKCSKLDRMLVSQDWFALGNWSVSTHDRFTSDHCPLSLTITPIDWGPKPFKLFNCWLEDPHFVEELKHYWSSGNCSSFTKKFKRLWEVAKIWSKDQFGGIDEKIRALQVLQRKADLEINQVTPISRVQDEMDRLIRIKVGVLRQKSRLSWELRGEKNTKFFHRAIAKRRHSNNISSISNGTGIISNPEGIRKILLDYFKSLLTTPFPGKVFNLGSSMLTSLFEREKMDLVKDFSYSGIEDALAATDGSKSPGPDGVNAGVLRSLWPVIRNDVMHFFFSFHSSHHIPRGYNSSFIVLIPKVLHPRIPSQFRPISLMNSIVKLLSKVLARRMRRVMNSLVGPTQSAFIHGRQISDSILIANEVIHSLQTKESAGVVLKIDFEKAFDNIRWGFVFEVLRSINFDSKWIDWISSIFESSRISVIVNGAPSEEFSPTKGLRQGDPLSPLLFNLIGEVLAKLLDRASNLHIFSGVSLPSYSSPITHLQFADDVILFLKPDCNSIIGVKRVLQTFQVLSGLKINFSKSSLYGYGQSDDNTRNWASLLGCEVGKGPLKYLGAELGSSPKLLKYWSPLVNKVHSKIKSYDASTLSVAGRLVLLKSAIDSIPTFWFSLYKIPSGIVSQIEKARRKFLWSGSTLPGAKKKLHLLNWERVCTPKSCGRLGLVPIQLRNKVLLAKWVWRAYKERGFFWNKFISARYGRAWNYDLNLVNSKSCSPIIKSIVEAHQFAATMSLMGRNSFKWILNSGCQILFWEDRWCEDVHLSLKFPHLYSTLAIPHLTVREFIHTWEVFELDNLQLWRERPSQAHQVELCALKAILQRTNLTDGSDILRWTHANGIFSTRDCFSHLLISPEVTSGDKRVWPLLWSIKAPPKILNFLWRIQWNIVPTRDFLNSRLHTVTNLCPWCLLTSESASHLFWHCELSIWAWEFVSRWWSLPAIRKFIPHFSLFSLLKIKVHKAASRIWYIVVAATLWSIWLARNELVFSNIKISKATLVDLIFLRVSKWGKASGLIEFGDTPLWKIHPQGAIALHTFTLRSSFWLHKGLCFDLVCAVDGAWGLIGNSLFGGGIGGTVRNNKGSLLFSFSGPVASKSVRFTEIDAILFVLQSLMSRNLLKLRTVICSDSAQAVNAFNRGLSVEFPHMDFNLRFEHVINISIFIHYVPRNLNDNADSLAKKGITRPYMSSLWTE